jgi:hypothetical protein
MTNSDPIENLNPGRTRVMGSIGHVGVVVGSHLSALKTQGVSGAHQFALDGHHMAYNSIRQAHHHHQPNLLEE